MDFFVWQMLCYAVSSRLSFFTLITTSRNTYRGPVHQLLTIFKISLFRAIWWLEKKFYTLINSIKLAVCYQLVRLYIRSRSVSNEAGSQLKNPWAGISSPAPKMYNIVNFVDKNTILVTKLEFYNKEWDLSHFHSNCCSILWSPKVLCSDDSAWLNVVCESGQSRI